MRSTHTLVVVASFFALSASALPAQNTQSTSFGVFGGVSRTTLVGENTADDLESRTGVHLGISMVKALSPRFGLEVDALYATKGFRSPGTASEFDFAISYFEIPILLRWNIAPAARVHPFLTAGPALSSRLDCAGTVTSGASKVITKCDDLASALAIGVGKTDFSAVLGAGIEFPMRRANVTLASRFSRGFLQVLSGQDNYNQGFSFYVGLSRQFSTRDDR